MTIQRYPVGVDCVWLGLDSAQHVGVFVTGGEGPIPNAVLEQSLLWIEDMELEVLGLPKVSDAELLVSVPRPDSFIALAERGLFVFDWADVSRTAGELSNSYELVASPCGGGISELDLPERLRGLARRASFQADYSVVQMIEVETSESSRSTR